MSYFMTGETDAEKYAAWGIRFEDPRDVARERERDNFIEGFEFPSNGWAVNPAVPHPQDVRKIRDFLSPWAREHRAFWSETAPEPAPRRGNAFIVVYRREEKATAKRRVDRNASERRRWQAMHPDWARTPPRRLAPVWVDVVDQGHPAVTMVVLRDYRDGKRFYGGGEQLYGLSHESLSGSPESYGFRVVFHVEIGWDIPTHLGWWGDDCRAEESTTGRELRGRPSARENRRAAIEAAKPEVLATIKRLGF